MSKDRTWSSPCLARDAAGKDRAGRRAGLDEPDRKADRGLDRRDSAARRHQQQRADKAGAAAARVRGPEIAPHQRLRCRRWRRRWRNARIRASPARRRTTASPPPAASGARSPRRCAARDPRLVKLCRKPIATASTLLRGERVDRARESCLVERHQHVALRVDPLAHRKAQAARHQRRRQIDVDVVLLEAVLVTDFDDVAEAFSRRAARSWRPCARSPRWWRASCRE